MSIVINIKFFSGCIVTYKILTYKILIKITNKKKNNNNLYNYNTAQLVESSQVSLLNVFTKEVSTNKRPASLYFTMSDQVEKTQNQGFHRIFTVALDGLFQIRLG